MAEWVRALLRWCRLRRRRLIALLVVIAALYAVGRFGASPGIPGACLIYG